jgi:NADH-quinone oxidoreductase subunit M
VEQVARRWRIRIHRAHAWAPSLGIEYHLGVDGLGALMLVLSAIVTLMSVDAAHRVHHQPGLYFALVLVLEPDSSDRSRR